MNHNYLIIRDSNQEIVANKHLLSDAQAYGAGYTYVHWVQSNSGPPPAPSNRRGKFFSGEITFTNGSPNVSAVNGKFTRELKVGTKIMLSTDNLGESDVAAEIQSITDDNNLVLTANYSFTGGTGEGVVIGQEIFSDTRTTSNKRCDAYEMELDPITARWKGQKDFDGMNDSTALTGTNAVFTNGSKNVSITGGAFTTELASGDFIVLDADNVNSEVDTITDNDNLVLKENYSGTGGTGPASKILKEKALAENKRAEIKAKYP